MVAVTLGLIIVAGLTGVFVSNTQSRGEIERTNRQVENGRYAMQVLTEDLRLAGYLGEFDPTNLPTPATLPDPCTTTVADLRTAMPLHVQGYDNGSSIPTCLSDVRTGTDILVIRRASSCVAGAANCDAVAANTPYFQASLCYPTAGATELASADINNYFALDTNTGNLNRTKRNCTTLADFRRYRTHIYFIANNNVSGDGIPTLKRAELGAGAFTIVPLVEGIENLQFEYGIDTDAISTANAGSPNAYTPEPDSYNGCIGQACVQNWRSVVAAKIHILARNTEKSPGHNDLKTYALGLNKDGTANSVGPFEDQYKRHVYQSSIRLNNPAGRREP